MNTLEIAREEISQVTPSRASCSKRSRVYDILGRLEKWDMSVQKRYMVEKGIYTAEEVDRVETEWKRFIAICLAHPGVPVPISQKVDDFWHTAILFTEDYAKMGQAVAGKFIHHRPIILDGESEIKYHFRKETLVLYEEFFGTPDPRYWAFACCKSCSCHT